MLMLRFSRYGRWRVSFWQDRAADLTRGDGPYAGLAIGLASGLPALARSGPSRVIAGGQCRVVKPCCLEVNNVVAIPGLRSGAVGACRPPDRAGRTGRGRFWRGSRGGFAGELGEQVRGFYAEPVSQFAAGPVLAGLAGHDAGDLVSSAARAGLAGAGPGRLVRAPGARGGRSGGGTTMVICTRVIVTDWQGRSWSRSWSRTW